MTSLSDRLVSGLVVTLLVAGLAACQDGSPLRPDARAARGGGAGGNGQGNPTAGCDVVVPDDQPGVQDGVDAASAGDVVCVKASGGPYTEQVVIGKDLTLKGIDGPVIRGPDTRAAFEIPESQRRPWEPIVFAVGGAVAGGDVSGSGTVEVTVRGLTVDGGGQPGPAGRRYVGIFYRNASGTVAGNTVRDMGVGAGETFGILAYGDSDVTISDNTVSGYERGGIGANGDGGAHPSPSVAIVGNRITGSGDGSQTAWGPNGIQVGFGATGRVMDNEVDRNRWASAEDDAWSASCILVFESDGVRIRGNEVSNCDVGIGVGSWAWFRTSADNTRITRNRVDGALIGLELEVIAWDGFSQASPSVSNTKLVRNRVSGTMPSGSSGDFGVRFETVDGDPDYEPVADDNKVVANAISGFDVRIETGSATNTKKAANRAFQP